jgi:ATP-binding cassette subfamily B protein
MKQAFKHLGWFFKQEYKRYILLAVLLLILSITPVIPTKLFGMVIDDIVGGALNVRRLIIFISSLALIPIARYIIAYIYHYYINYLGHKLSYNLREKYIAHLFDMDSSLYAKYTKGDLISRATGDLQNLTVLATSFLQIVVFNSGVVISTVTSMLLISPILMFASTFFMPIAIFYLNKKRMIKRKYYSIHREIYANMTESVLESIEGVKAIRAYTEEENDFKKAKEAIEADADSWWKILKFESIYGPLFELVYAVSYFIGIAFGVYLVVTNKLTAGSLITMLMYIGMLYGPLIALSNTLNNVNNITISDERYHEILEISPEVKDGPKVTSEVNFEEIEFKNVSFRYPYDEDDVIKDFNLKIRKGETIGIVGPTGSGKSTLIRQLLREYNLTDGNIFIDGIPINEYKVEDIRNLIGYVPQDHVLFRRTVDDNILIGNPAANPHQVDLAITLADFKKDVKELPSGMTTMVSEMGSSLSGGQKQRLSIARALVKDPMILILDDSLSAVDALTEKNIIEHLKEARSNRTNIIISHRFSAVAAADKIIVLQNGRITDIGSHKELLQYDNWYKNQYLKQTNGDENEEF